MKRLLAFVMLLGVGLLALWVAIGDEDAVRANGNEPRKKQERRPDAPGGITMQNGGIGASFSQSGPFELREWREVPLGDGRVRKEETYVLKATDSRPTGEGLQHLIGVTLQLFDDGEHTATVQASDAFVELGRDIDGRIAIDGQKAIDLRNAVFTTEPDSRMAGLRLELGDARVLVGDNEIQLTTSPEQAVKLVIEGDRPATLIGKGAQARLPRNRKAGLRRADIEILHDPVLTTEDLRVEATGRMHYVEDTVTGAAQITLDDNVQLDLSRSGLALPGLPRNSDGEPTRSSVRGDQFTGWLLRSPADEQPDSRSSVSGASTSEPSGSESSGSGSSRSGSSRSGKSMIWQRLVLVGAPATIDVPGIHVETPRLTVLPGPLGEPFLVTAHGGESRVQQTELRAGGKQTDPVTGISPRRIHLIRPGDAAPALHRYFGFPRWTLRSLDQQQIVVFEGASRLESGVRTMRASEGFMVVRRESRQTGIVQGFGDVEVVQRGEAKKPGGKPQPDLVATGNDGLLLIVGKESERLRLGPRKGTAGFAEHRYDVTYGDSKLRGLGACMVERTDERTRIAVAAPFNEIEADFGQEGTELRNVHQLHAVLVGEQLVELDVGGLPVRAALVRDGERVLAQAPRLLQIGPRSLRLLPIRIDETPWSEISEIDRTPRLLRKWSSREHGSMQSVEVIGPRIDVHHAGGHNVIIDATAENGELPRVYASLPQPGRDEATTVTCAADRIRILPFVLPPAARRFHLAGSRGPIADVIFHSLARPWLLVDNVRDFQLDDAEQGHLEGTGKRLFVSHGGAAALFVGDPDALTPATVHRTQNGRTVTMEGARVRVYRDDEVRLTALGFFDDRSTFLAPTMTLHEPGATGLLSHMRTVCRGNIQVDPDAVRFGGPVVAYGLTESGEDDPDGIHIDARHLEMARSPADGKFKSVIGKDVEVKWSRLDVRATEVELDLRRSRCIARDVIGAEVDLPDGRELRSTSIEVNYETWAVNMARGVVRQRAAKQNVTGQEGDK